MGAFYEYRNTLAYENGELKIKRKRELVQYCYQPVEHFITRLGNKGYDCIQLSEGVTQIGDWICLPPTPDGKYYVIRERVANEWCGYMTVEPRKRLTKAETAEVEEYKKGNWVEVKPFWETEAYKKAKELSVSKEEE